MRGARAHAEPGAVGQAHGGLGHPVVVAPGQGGDGRAVAIALAQAPPAPIALDEGPAAAHEPDDTMRRVRRMQP